MSKSKSERTRRLHSWLDGFLDFTESLPTCPRFRMWAGLATVSATLERKVFTVLSDKPLYPNLYVILVSPPGIGKSVAIMEAKDLVSGIRGMTLAPDIVTKEKLYGILEKSYKTDIQPDGKIFEQSSVAAYADEMAVLIKRGDVDGMASLSKLYDCAKTLDKSTVTSTNNYIIKPSLNLIGGVTPVWLKENFTDDAFETGFPARCILVYDESEKKYDLFAESAIRPELYVELKHDIRRIYEMKGEYKWEKAAAETFQAWVSDGLPPKVEDPKFQHYNRRRLLHVAKLSMAIAASFSSELVVRLSDFEQAQEILLDAEETMHLAAAGMGSNPYKYHMDIIFAFVAASAKNGNGVEEYRVRQKLSRDVPLQYIEPMITSMIDMKMLWEEPMTEAPTRILWPGKQLHLYKDSLDESE